MVYVADLVKLQTNYKGDKQMVHLAVSADQSWVLKVDDPEALVTKIKQAQEHAAKYGKTRPPKDSEDDERPRGKRVADSTSDVEDSDEDADDGFAMPTAPKWFQAYDKLTKDKDRESKWMDLSLKWLASLFSDIFQVSVLCPHYYVRPVSSFEFVCAG
jgi:hypothetical protein